MASVSCGMRNFRNAKLCETFRTACVDAPKRANCAKLVPHRQTGRNYLPLICRLAVTAKAFGSPQLSAPANTKRKAAGRPICFYMYHVSYVSSCVCLLIAVHRVWIWGLVMRMQPKIASTLTWTSTAKPFKSIYVSKPATNSFSNF